MAAEWGCRNVLVRTSQVILATDGGNWALGDRFTELNYFLVLYVPTSSFQGKCRFVLFQEFVQLPKTQRENREM